MKTVTIPEVEYKKLLKENNSLRKLINQLVENYNKLNLEEEPLNKRTASPKDLSKMTPKQIQAYYDKKLQEKYGKY